MDQATGSNSNRKELSKEQKKHLKQERMVKRAEHRRSEWIDAVATNDQFVDAYMHGSLLLKHPSQHDFRPPCDKEPMYNRRYETSMDRATRKENEHKATILEKLNYNEREPNRKYYLRPRDNILEVQPPMRYQPRDKMERIRQSVDNNTRVNLDQLDTKKLYFPVFNEDERHKWITKKGFSMEGFKQAKIAHWNEIHNNCSAGINPFLNGLQAIADQKVERMRQSHKEISKVPFCSTVAPDQWKNSLVNTNSLRSMKSIHASIDALKFGSSKISTTQLPKIDSFRDTSKALEKSNDVSPFQLHSMKNTQTQFKISPRSFDEENPQPKDEPSPVDKSNEKKQIKLMKKHLSVIGVDKSVDISRTQNIEDMMQQWTNNQSLKILNPDKSPFKGTSNQMYATQMQYFNDQHLTKQIYNEKLYFQSAQRAINKDKSPAYKKHFGKMKGPNQTFNISDNIFLSTHQSNNKQALDGSIDHDTSVRYQIKAKEDFKAEVEKQQIHSYLQKSIIKQTNFSDLVNELKVGKDETDETHNMTTSTRVTLNPRSNSLRVLPSLQPSPNTEFQKNPGFLIQVNRGNETNSLFSSPKNFQKQSAMTPFGQLLKLKQQSPRRNEGSVEKAEEIDFSYRKQQVQKMLNHFFK